MKKKKKRQKCGGRIQRKEKEEAEGEKYGSGE